MLLGAVVEDPRLAALAGPVVLAAGGLGAGLLGDSGLLISTASRRSVESRSRIFVSRWRTRHGRPGGGGGVAAWMERGRVVRRRAKLRWGGVSAHIEPQEWRASAGAKGASRPTGQADCPAGLRARRTTVGVPSDRRSRGLC